jgi:hypothetical protein
VTKLADGPVILSQAQTKIFRGPDDCQGKKALSIIWALNLDSLKDFQKKKLFYTKSVTKLSYLTVTYPTLCSLYAFDLT